MKKMQTVILFIVYFIAASACASSNFSLVSIGDDESLPESHYNGDHSAVTPDGRFVVFRSSESGFVTPRTQHAQIFLRDRVAGTTELISQNNSGQYGDASSDWPSISNDGCKVVFESGSTNLVSGDTNGVSDVFLRDRCSLTPITTLISASRSGAIANGESNRGDISGNGAYVVFYSAANNLISVPGAFNGSQIYRRNVQSNEVTLISDSLIYRGSGANRSSYCPAVSDDGSRVVFWSRSDDLVDNDTTGMWDIFYYDEADKLSQNHIRRASEDSQGIPQNQGDEGTSTITCPTISGDGRYIAFASRSTSLVYNDTNDQADIFLKDTLTGKLERASVNSNGEQADSASYERPALSNDGTSVAFLSTATNLDSLTGPTTGVTRIYVHNRLTGKTFTLNPDKYSSNGGDPPAISDDVNGRYVTAFIGDEMDPAHQSSGVFLYDRGGPANNPPVADAGIDQRANKGVLVTLDGSKSSDPEGQPLTYHWSQLAGPMVQLANETDSTTTFVPSQAGSYIFTLKVNDGVQESEPDMVAIRVDDPAVGSRLEANAGSDQHAPIGEKFNLLGTATILDPSIIPNQIRYFWQQESGPAVVLSGSPTGKKRFFVPTTPGVYVFSLVVSNGIVESEKALVSITVAPSISVTAPTANTLWTYGQSASISWTAADIKANSKLALVYSPDAGSNFYVLKKVPASRGSYAFKVKPQMISTQAVIGVCLLETSRNDRICGQMDGTFTINY